MTDDGGPRLVYLGTTDGADTIIIPRAALASAEQKLDAEHARREKIASGAKLRTMQSARAHGKLRKALFAVFGRGRRR
jgi:hypothetical protein